MVALPYLKLIIYIIVIVINSFLAIVVYRENHKSATNLFFGSLSICTSLWLVAMYLSTNQNYLPWSLFLIRSSIFFAVPQSVLFFLLAHTIPSSKLQLSKHWLGTLILLSVIMMGYTLTPLVFKGVTITNGTVQTIVSPGIVLFSFFVAVFSLSAIFLLIKKMIKMRGVERQQIKFVLIGICGMLGLIIITILIPVIFFNTSSFVQYAWLYVLFFLILTAVAILRYHLFDIKVLATELLSVILVLVLIFEGASSGSFWQIIYKLIFSVLVAFFGYFLVKSVKKEIKQREQLEILSKELQNANIRLQELDKQKTEFMSIASHQLRTPLSILKGYIELIQDGAYGKAGKKLLKVLHDMDESNERLIKLVDEFLNVSRIEEGRTKFVFHDCDLVELISGVITELKARAESRGLVIKWKPEKEKLVVNVDDEKIRQIVFNFVDNAIKYTNAGDIKITFDNENDGVNVRVNDNGCGFNKIDEANFFTKFYRGENVKGTNVTGTGIGLFVCKKFAEAHGGRVWAHSPGLGKGSEFGFWVPLKHIESVAGEKAEVANAV